MGGGVEGISARRIFFHSMLNLFVITCAFFNFPHPSSLSKGLPLPPNIIVDQIPILGLCNGETLVDIEV